MPEKTREEHMGQQQDGEETWWEWERELK